MADKQVHELKTDPDVFDAVYRGAKTHEIRYDDRGFRVGDELWLRETHWSGDHMRNVGKPLIYTGRECRRTVSHVLVGYGLQPGWCILSFASTPLQHPSTRPSSVEGAHLSDERILHLWDTHVAYETGQSVKQPPLGNADKLAFARAVLADASGVAIPRGGEQK